MNEPGILNKSEIRMINSIILKKLLFVLLIFFVITPFAHTQNVFWGSSAGPFPNEKGVSSVQAWVRLNEKIKSLNEGHGLHARRTYDTSLPVSWESSVMAADENLCKVSLYSFKTSWTTTANGSNYQAIKQFVQSIPDDRIVYLIFYHEPEDNGVGDLFTSAFAKFVDAVLDAGKPNVHPTFVLMSWTWNPNSGRNPEDWNVAPKLKPGQISRVVAGLDGYSHDPVNISAESAIGRGIGFNAMETWGFSRFGIFETSTRRMEGPNGRAKWISDLAAWVNRHGKIEVVSWFHSGVGQNAGEEGWFLGQWWIDSNENYIWEDTDGSIAAYASLIPASGNGSQKIDNNPLNLLKAFPNPFNDYLTLNSPEQFNYTIYSTTGKILERGRNGISTEAGHKLNPGIYLVKVENEYQVQTFKMIKQKNVF